MLKGPKVRIWLDHSLTSQIIFSLCFLPLLFFRRVSQLSVLNALHLLTWLTTPTNNQRPLTAFEAGPFDSRRCVQPTTISHQFMDSCLGPRIAHEKSIQRNSIRVWAAVYKNRGVSRGRMYVLISFSRWPSRLQQGQDAPHGVPLYLLILKVPF